MLKRITDIFKLIALFSVVMVSNLFFYSCRSENEEEYFKNYNGNDTLCDTAYVTYSKQMKLLFDAKCVSCHTGGSVSGCDLENYNNVMVYVNAHVPVTKLFDWVKDNTHQGVVLDSCELKQFKKWMLNPAP